MSFQSSNNRGKNCVLLAVELQNRKILEDLQMKKQILLKQGAAPTNPTVSTPIILSAEHQHQRAAFLAAQAQSTGYYIPQDSPFGNIVLPVLPRFENNA